MRNSHNDHQQGPLYIESWTTSQLKLGKWWSNIILHIIANIIACQNERPICLNRWNRKKKRREKAGAYYYITLFGIYYIGPCNVNFYHWKIFKYVSRFHKLIIKSLVYIGLMSIIVNRWRYLCFMRLMRYLKKSKKKSINNKIHLLLLYAFALTGCVAF